MTRWKIEGPGLIVTCREQACIDDLTRRANESVAFAWLCPHVLLGGSDVITPLPDEADDDRG